MTNIIIAGTRTFNDYAMLDYEVKKFIVENKIKRPVSIVCGMAQGADLLGKTFAENYNIPVIEMPADWEKFGKSAGYIRNKEMAKISQYCICFYNGESRGTKHMIHLANEYKLILKVVEYERNSRIFK